MGRTRRKSWITHRCWTCSNYTICYPSDRDPSSPTASHINFASSVRIIRRIRFSSPSQTLRILHTHPSYSSFWMICLLILRSVRGGNRGLSVTVFVDQKSRYSKSEKKQQSSDLLTVLGGNHDLLWWTNTMTASKPFLAASLLALNPAFVNFLPLLPSPDRKLPARGYRDRFSLGK